MSRWVDVIALADANLVVPHDRVVADRSCTDADAHSTHSWTDGRRAWTCSGRTDAPRPWATVSYLAPAGAGPVSVSTSCAAHEASA